jgi:hypothetical protein
MGSFVSVHYVSKDFKGHLISKYEMIVYRLSDDIWIFPKFIVCLVSGTNDNENMKWTPKHEMDSPKHCQTTIAC